MSAASGPDPRLGARFVDALGYAVDAHGGQARKGSAIPYLGHLLEVTGMVLDAGGSEDEAIAALLHDAGEDQGGEGRVADIEHRFGTRVAQIVRGCSDTLEDPKPPWPERKRAYLAHLAATDDDGVLRVSLADKVNNARSLLRDVQREGPGYFDHFNAGRDRQLAYYRRLVQVYRRTHPEWPMVTELDRVVEALAVE